MLKHIYEAFNLKVEPTHVSSDRTDNSDDVSKQYTFEYNWHSITIYVMVGEQNVLVFGQDKIRSKVPKALKDYPYGLYLDFTVDKSYSKRDDAVTDMKLSYYVFNCVKYVIDNNINSRVQFIQFSGDSADESRIKSYTTFSEKIKQAYGFKKVWIMPDEDKFQTNFVIYK